MYSSVGSCPLIYPYLVVVLVGLELPLTVTIRVSAMGSARFNVN